MFYSYLIIFSSIIADLVLCEHEFDDPFIIATEGCNIYDISDELVSLKAMNGPPETENCHQDNQLLESNATHVWLLKDVFASLNIHYEKALSCCYSNFSANKNIKNISYSDCQQQFDTVLKAQHEFVRVDCFYEDSLIYTDYFVFTPHEAKPKRQINESTYNVIILGLESISRLNFERTMPKTAKFLKERGAIGIRGYNKVGYNSFPNLFPLLTGRSFDFCKTKNCSFIWELFRNAGYYTALGSDSSVGAMGSYEYHWPAIPTDYYLQPFMAETDNVLPDVYVYNRSCLGSKPFYKILLNYIKGLLRILKYNNKLFGFFWEESVSHDHLKKPQMMDDGYLQFLTALENEKHLHDTIVIVLSDHGMRWEHFANTVQGRLEGRLPLLSILLPESFRKQYEVAYKNIQINSHRLSTPYDAYRTLVDLINPAALKNLHLKDKMEVQQSVNNSTSLFLPLSRNRTCRSVGIEAAWCSCASSSPALSLKQEAAIAATVLLERINQVLTLFSKCHTLTVKKVLGNAELTAITASGRTYTVTVETGPGGGIFQGMVRSERSHWTAFGPITRLNRKIEQRSCVEDDLIKLYCFCI